MLASSALTVVDADAADVVATVATGAVVLVVAVAPVVDAKTTAPLSSTLTTKLPSHPSPSSHTNFSFPNPSCVKQKRKKKSFVGVFVRVFEYFLCTSLSFSKWLHTPPYGSPLLMHIIFVFAAFFFQLYIPPCLPP